jgi:hypothetical protein
VSKVVWVPKDPAPPKTKRYTVQRWFWDGWEDYKSYRWRWRAIRAANYGQSLGVFDYRVIDTQATKED